MKFKDELAETKAITEREVSLRDGKNFISEIMQLIVSEMIMLGSCPMHSLTTLHTNSLCPSFKHGNPLLATWIKRKEMGAEDLLILIWLK